MIRCDTKQTTRRHNFIGFRDGPRCHFLNWLDYAVDHVYASIYVKILEAALATPERLSFLEYTILSMRWPSSWNVETKR